MNPHHIDFRNVKPGIFDNNYHFIADVFLRASITLDFFNTSETEVNWNDVTQLRGWVNRNEICNMEQLQSYDPIIMNSLSYLFNQKDQDNPVKGIGDVSYRMRHFSFNLRDAENLSKDELVDLTNFCYEAYKSFRIMGEEFQPY